MKCFLRRFLVLASILFVFFMPSVAQSENSFELLKDEISSMLPPLAVLIDSAMTRDPYVLFYDLQIAIEKSNLKIKKTEWTRNLGLQSDFLFGTFDNIASNSGEGYASTLITSKMNQMHYRVGAWVKIPLADILERKNLTARSVAEVEQAKAMVVHRQQEVRELVIRQYNELILKQRLLKIKSKYLSVAQSNTLMAEKEFVSGVQDITELSRISQISSEAESDFERVKIEFLTAYMLLEEIVGFNFQLDPVL